MLGRAILTFCGFFFVIFAIARGVQLQKWLKERPRTPDPGSGFTNPFRIGHRIGGETVYISDADKAWEYKFSRLIKGVGLLAFLFLSIAFFAGVISHLVR